MKTSEKGLNLIMAHEGMRTTAYLCPAGVWTIGFGHTKGVKQGQMITARQATEYLIEDVGGAESAINRHLSRLNQNQFDALVSFIFNVGAGNFEKSTLLKKARINPNDPTIRGEFAKWKYAGKKELPGLVRRRLDEANLYFTK